MPYDPSRADGAYLPEPQRYERMPYRRVGASGIRLPSISLGQLEQNVAALAETQFTAQELETIDRHAQESAINIWAPSSDA